MSLLIGDGSVVNMHYTLKNDDGAVLDSSEGADTLAYLHGAGNIIPGLEKALLGKTSEDTFQVRIEPEEGYGELDTALIDTVDRAAFQGVDSIEVGMTFETQGADGAGQRITIKAIEGDRITVDGNHPLAGVALTFDIEIVGVREATSDEIAHGHAH